MSDTRAATYHALHATDAASTRYLSQQPLPDRLKGLGKPLLVIFKKEDHRFRATSAQRYLAVLGAQVDVLPGVGHSPILEDPTDTARLILGFLGALPG